MNYDTSQTPLTPVHTFEDWSVKREDLACNAGPEEPNGAKMRQFEAMAKAHPAGTPMIVGCSANSAMQVYIASAARRAGCGNFIFLPNRNSPTQSTRWAIRNGGNLCTLKPGYASQYRKAAKDKAVELGGCIRWDRTLAIEDAARQTENLPDGCRVVVPTGTGLTATGIIVGIARRKWKVQPTVFLVRVSGLSDVPKMLDKAREVAAGADLPSVSDMLCPVEYDTPAHRYLPDGTRLDPWYAAKVVPYLKTGDVLWNTGTRPVSAMP